MKYKFEIGAFTPETIPMSRLAAYMMDLAKLLGEQNSVHFDALEEGSTIQVMRIDEPAAPKVRLRLQLVGGANAPADLAAAYAALNKKLAEDNATGSLYTTGDEGVKTNIIQFPGIKNAADISYSGIKEAGFLQGIVVSLGGRDNTAHIQLQDGNVVYTKIETNKSLAKELAPYLWGAPIRISGEGTWSRVDGAWRLDRFKVSSFEVLEHTTLEETVRQLRAVEGSGWKKVVDPFALLREIRDGIK